MDNRPIGVFDSGLGGLTCIPFLQKALPSERFVYYGDTARTPYGSKDPNTVQAFSFEICDFLVKQNVKAIVIACNTVSSIALPGLRKTFPDLPIIGIVEPAAEAVSGMCEPGSHVGIIATKVTVGSGIYPRLLKESGLSVFQKACPAFVPLIEEGIIDSEIMRLTIRHYLDDFIPTNGIDTLVLGCTHYPLILSEIRSLYPGLRIVNPSETIVETVADALRERSLLSDGSVDYDHIFYASDLSENFLNMIERIEKQGNFRVRFHTVDHDSIGEKR